MKPVLRWRVLQLVNGEWQFLYGGPAERIGRGPDEVFQNARRFFAPRKLGPLKGHQFLDGALSPLVWLEGADGRAETAAP